MFAHYGRMLFLLGLWTSITAFLAVIPALFALIDDDYHTFQVFLSTSLFAGFFALTFVISFWGYERRRTMGALILLPVLGFLFLAVVGGLPQFLLAENSHWSLILFEGMSSITTTGVSATADPSAGLYAVVLWRALLSWLGAFGSVILALTIASHVNAGGLRLHRSPVHVSDAGSGHARLSATAMRLMPFYIGLTSVIFLSFWIVGAGFRDSIILALSVISTAGITSDIGSAIIPSGMVQAVALGAMIIASLNLDYHYAYFKGQKSVYFQDGETRLFFIMAFAAFMVVLFVRWITLQDPGGMLAFLWDGLFLSLSALTTTGWVPENIATVPVSLSLLIVLVGLTCVGGSVSSTTGGLKILRLIILIRHGARELARLAHPHGVARLRFASVQVGERDLQAVWLLVAGFLLFLVVGTLLLAIQGLGFQTSFLLALTSLTTSGPLMYLMDIDFTGYNGLLPQDYTVLSILMLVGRLEVSIFLALLTKAIWRS